MDTELRTRIKHSVTMLVETLSQELGQPRAAVADLAYLHLQKHPVWGRNPSKSQKRAAHRRWGGACQACLEIVALDEAVFHHLKRRVDDQHDPHNLLPYHDKCHDKHHGVVQDSLSKGSPKVRRK